VINLRIASTLGARPIVPVEIRVRRLLAATNPRSTPLELQAALPDYMIGSTRSRR
jgi:hypothetical protein